MVDGLVALVMFYALDDHHGWTEDGCVVQIYEVRE